MVQELIDSLSDEQRMCILMYHMEDMPIKEIAATLGCSESTVKSRLNYGRQNLKAKAEEMQKKGYKLYSIAPLALLLLLLHTDAQAMYTEPAFLAAGRQISNHIFSQISSLGYVSGSRNAGTGSESTTGENSGTNSGANSGTKGGQTGAADSTAASGAASGAKEAAKSGAGKAAQAGILSTRAGQILIGAIGAAVIAGSGVGIATVVRNNNEGNIAKKQGGEVVVIQDADDMADEASPVTEQSDEQPDQQTITNSIKDVYEQVLADVQADKYTFSFVNDALAANGFSDGYQYFLSDMDNDGIQELIVAEIYCWNSYTGIGVFFWNDCLVFTAQQQNGSWSAKQIEGEKNILSAFIPSDGNGINIMTDYGRGTGEAEYHRVTIVNGALYTWPYTDEADGTLVEGYDIDDLSGLSGVG